MMMVMMRNNKPELPVARQGVRLAPHVGIHTHIRYPKQRQGKQRKDDHSLPIESQLVLFCFIPPAYFACFYSTLL